MKKGKILVTGGAGYIGAHTVVELINAGFEPVIIDDLSKSDTTLLDGIQSITGKQLPFIKGSCNDADTVRKTLAENGPFQCVMHFAAYKSVGESVQNPLLYFRNNIGSLVTLMEAMKDVGVYDLIFSSSCTVYGQPDIIPVNEDAPFKKAESPYGASKQMCERILEDAQHIGFRIVSLRYFNPIGAHPSAKIGELPIGPPNNLVPYITQTAIGKRSKLTVFGGDYNTPDGSCVRDFIHVVDLAEAHVKAIEYQAKTTAGGSYDVFNLGTGVGSSVLQLIKEFNEVSGIELPYSIGPRRPGDVEQVFGDPRKANELLNWSTRFSTQDALLHAWNWEKHLNSIK